MAKKKEIEKPFIGLVDADLLDNGTRHPNLTLMKIAGFLHDNKIPFELIIDNDADISKYTRIYMSRVFSFTKEPDFYLNASDEDKQKFQIGGTGYYANETSIRLFTELRGRDMNRLNEDAFLNQYLNVSGKWKMSGIEMKSQKPYYDLYKTFVDRKVAEGFKRDKYKDYEKYSIGFLTRGCIRHCPFCVNKTDKLVFRYSEVEDFLDNDRDENGRLKRPNIYLWDDNFLAADKKIWKPLLQSLIDTNRPFQFRQGLDERMLVDSKDGEEMAEMLSKSKYHGDFIFAFDNWKDREKIEKALKIWKKYNPKKGTKFYLFCGFKQNERNKAKFYQDIWEIFQRIKILMQYGCVGYVMRHEDYHKAPIPNIYVQIARWCNQQQFYKKMSFWEFCYRNQTFWEEETLHRKVKPLKTYKEFLKDQKKGYYDDIKIARPLQTLLDFLDMFGDKKEEILELFNIKMMDLKNPKLWE